MLICWSPPVDCEPLEGKGRGFSPLNAMHSTSTQYPSYFGGVSTVVGPERFERAGPRWSLGCRTQAFCSAWWGCAHHGGIQMLPTAHSLCGSASLCHLLSYLVPFTLVPSHSASFLLPACVICDVTARWCRGANHPWITEEGASLRLHGDLLEHFRPAVFRAEPLKSTPTNKLTWGVSGGASPRAPVEASCTA